VRKAIIPDDLLGDEHLREEFGVNGITTPSIEAIFELLDTLGTLNYDQLKRPIKDSTPSDRVAVSLSLGALIADGFLIVQCEKIEEMNDIGRALLKHAKVLGAGTRMNRHSQSLLEMSLKGDWKTLRTELSKTQFDVEAEMVQLRDVDIAHLVSLGGWMRAFQIATQSVVLNYDPEKPGTRPPRYCRVLPLQPGKPERESARTPRHGCIAHRAAGPHAASRCARRQDPQRG